MDLRNIAIIAHVDHGKTTLVDRLLAQSGAVRANQQVADRAMDSNDLERERGITILAKCASVDWTPAQNENGGAPVRINIVDTPGHADFGGEVERVLSMVDGVLLLVDAADGPMPQTKFVLSKALAQGLRPIVVINKVDRPDGRPDAVHDEVFDLFAALDANEDQLDFPTLFASAKEGWARLTAEDDGAPRDMSALFAAIAAHVPPPEATTSGAADEPFTMLSTTLEADPYLGRILTGRIERGVVRPNMMVSALSRDGDVIERGMVSKVLAFRGLGREPVEEAQAGDIVAIAGLKTATVADTLCAPEVSEALPSTPIDPPTMAVTFVVNDSPFAGREGDKVQSRVIRARLLREAEGNVAISVTETDGADAYEVAGRGELQLGVLIETMRREGFELGISRPRVLFQTDPDSGQQMEPIEEVTIDVDDEFSGVVIEKLAERKGEMLDLRPTGAGKTRIVFDCPSRGLIGYHGDFLSDTRGTGVMNRVYKEYGPHRGAMEGRRNGVLLSMAQGDSVAYGLMGLEERGQLFIGSGTPVYAGMIIGENARGGDLEVNPLKAKQLTNIRASGKDDAVRLTPPRKMSLEQAIAYISDDELVEVTPKSIRLRSRYLDTHERKRAMRATAAQ